MTKLKALALVTEWQERLGLRDWEINVEFKPKKLMPAQMAVNAIHSDRRICRLHIRWPHRNNSGEPDDLEQTIAHELLHCWFDPWYPTNPDRNKHKVMVLENAVDAIATALVEAKRSPFPQ